VVRTRLDDEVSAFKPADAVTTRIGENVAEFLSAELKAGRIPAEFLPVQSGVGNIANAVLAAMGGHPGIPAFEMYSEVIQNSVIELMKTGRVRFGSGTSLTVTPDLLAEIYGNLGFFKDRIVLRPQEITNHPEVIRRLGVIAVNTALEVDIFGNVNSTHVMGRDLMNGIGGSGDFTRNGFLSIFTCPSVAKGGKISAVVPLVSHMDHSEHSVQVIVTEQGVADLRGKDPQERAEAIVKNCVHPEYRDALTRYFHGVKGGHTPQSLREAFALHERYLETGDMRG
jgi:acetyl-CoA hydrolase